MIGRRTTGASRLVGEFLLIVGGVTVALAADSLWSARQERVRETEYLVQLRSDLAENRERLEAAIEDEETIGAAALTALNAVKSGQRISRDSARAWIIERRGLYYSDPRLLTGTFSGLVESGDLRLVRDAAIRRAIIGYLPQVSSDRGEFDRWVDAFIAGIAPIRTVVLTLPSYAGTLGETSVDAVSAFPAHPLLAEVLDSAIWTNEIRLIYLRRMLEATDSAAAVLSQPDRAR
ncbi:MAG: hypothetical protein ACC682_14695 [Gemmatimonadota bacterium]